MMLRPQRSGGGKTPGCSRKKYLLLDLRDIFGSTPSSSLSTGIIGFLLAIVALNSMSMDSFSSVIEVHVRFLLFESIETRLFSSSSRGLPRLNWMLLPNHFV